jgi:hypothetical protein
MGLDIDIIIGASVIVLGSFYVLDYPINAWPILTGVRLFLALTTQVDHKNASPDKQKTQASTQRNYDNCSQSIFSHTSSSN